MANERRSDDRIKINVSARIFNAPGEVVLGEGRLMDVSTGGAKVITSAGANYLVSGSYILGGKKTIEQAIKDLFAAIG